MSSSGFGIHLLFDGYECCEKKLADANAIEQLLENLPRRLEMHPICDPVVVNVGANNRKDPGGLSGFVMVAESHISIHTFPKRGFVSADVYTCHNDLDVKNLVKILSAAFETKSVDFSVQKRGVNYPEFDIHL